MMFKKEISLSELLNIYKEEEKFLWHFGGDATIKKRIRINEELEPFKIVDNYFFYNIEGIHLISSTKLERGVYDGVLILEPNKVYFNVKRRVNYA